MTKKIIKTDKCKLCKRRTATTTATMDEGEVWKVCDYCKAKMDEMFYEAQLEATEERGFIGEQNDY